MSSAEFSEWQWADHRGELPDDYDLFGMLAAAVMNAGFRYPKKPVGAEDFRPKLAPKMGSRDKAIAIAKQVARPTVLTNETTWNT